MTGPAPIPASSGIWSCTGPTPRPGARGGWRIWGGPAGGARAGRYQIEIVDVLKSPRRAAADQILAAPTVVRRLPAPIRRLVGDLSDSDRLLIGLELRQYGDQA